MLSTPDRRTNVNRQYSFLDVEIKKLDSKIELSVKNFIEGSSGESNEESQMSSRNSDVTSVYDYFL
jgi:hypothetical protein